LLLRALQQGLQLFDRVGHILLRHAFYDAQDMRIILRYAALLAFFQEIVWRR
jgi:hypothetical protein